MSASPPDPRAVQAARRALLPELEARLAAEEPPSLDRALRIADALLAEARALGVWPPADRLEGIEVDVRVAGALRRVR
ncbi:MAG TPA: hypothetical protein VFI16_02265 [Anaeromyxobacteraceae bacterium]|nr:hypothetical protein [Anaeromyxobacteraceae bacterium]